MFLVGIRWTPGAGLGVPLPPQSQSCELVGGDLVRAPGDRADPLHVAAAAVQAGGGGVFEDAPGFVLYC